MKDMGTHVPFIVSWKNHAPQGAVYSDLIDFTDFYPTLMEAARWTPNWVDPVDGQSFFPRLLGARGNPRDWVFWHYQPYWGQVPGQAVRTADYKLYGDGRLYHVPKDLEEGHDLSQSVDPALAKVRDRLSHILKQAPPAHSEKGSSKTTIRPTYPMWVDLDDRH